MKKFLPVTILICAMLLSGTFLSAQNNLVVRPYGKVGILLTPPNTADLDYSLNGIPGGLDDQQTVDVKQFAFGSQLLLENDKAYSLGAQFGFQNSFRSTIIGDVTSTIIYSNDYDNEWDLYLGPVIEKNLSNSNMYVQGGLDLHIRFWQYISDFASIYDDVYKTSGGVYTCFGMHGDIGTKIKFSDKLEVPLALRTELIFTYGVLFQVGFMFGLNFQ